MHELSLARSLVKTVLAGLSEKGISQPVKTVFFSSGKLNALLPSSLIFYFDVVKKEHVLLQNAALHISQKSVTAFCPSCQQEFVLDEPDFSCRQCRSPLQLTGGREMLVESIELEDC